MARIKIKDLPRDRKISKEEMKKVMGGINMIYKPPSIAPSPMTSSIGQAGLLTPVSGAGFVTVT